MEVFIQSTFQFRALQSARLFSDLYDIEERAVEKALAAIEREGSKYGMKLNKAKCELLAFGHL